MTSPRARTVASRSSRLAAWLVDVVLNTCCALPAFVAGVAGEETNFRLFVGISLACYLGLWTYQAWLRATRGQTIGKKIQRIRIVSYDDGSNPGFWRAVFLRDLVPSFIDIIAVRVFWTIDHAFILGRDRRCVHDYMAATIVVGADPRREEWYAREDSNPQPPGP